MDGSGFSGVVASTGGDPDNQRENKVGDAVVHTIARVARKLGPVGRTLADKLPEHT